MGRSRPARQRAESYLRTVLGAGVSRLPPITSCAKAAGVSYVTMWKAISALRERGELARVGEVAPTAPPRSARWEELRSAIIRGIVSGRLAAGGFVSIKEIALDFGTCYRTARAAVDSLQQQGWLVRDRKQFRVRSPAVGRPGETVVLLATFDRTRSASTLSPRQQELIRACEIHCSRMRLAFEPLQLPRGGDPRSAESVRIPAGPAIAGYLVWMGDVGTAALELLLGRLETTGKPIAVLDEVGDVSPGSMRGSRPTTAFFSMANSASAGMAMGRHLLGLGHTNAAFLLGRHVQPWADNRFEGMRAAFLASGPGAAVSSCEIRPGQSGHSVASLLEEVVRDPRVTAVVAENDHTALECLDWLESHGVRPGHDLSVAGFDDTTDAFLRNLTSYNFSCDSTAHAMLAHLVGQRPRGSAHRAEVFEVEGFVTARSSTGRPPAPQRVQAG